jgi:hypothetical protein
MKFGWLVSMKVILLSRSKESKDLFEAVHTFIATTYNARSHRVVKAHADAEGVMKSMTAVFGSIGIVLTLSPPGQHAQRVERYTQHLNKGVRATLDSLPYVPPPEFMLYLDTVADAITLVPNSASFPLSPYEKVHQQRRVFHATLPFLAFGTVCSVGMGIDKRDAKARKDNYHTANVPKSELDVCVGHDPAFPGSYLCYVHSTRKIIPRKVIKVLDGVIPFGWPPKTSMFQMLKQFPVDHEPAVLPNVSIQQLPVESPELHTSRVQDFVLDQKPQNVQFFYSNGHVQMANSASSRDLAPPIAGPLVAVAPVPSPSVSAVSTASPVVVQYVPPLVTPAITAPLQVIPVSQPLPVVSTRVVSSAPVSNSSRRPTRVRNAPAGFTYDALGGNPPGFFGSAPSIVATIEDNYEFPSTSGSSPTVGTSPSGALLPLRQRSYRERKSASRAAAWVSPPAADESWYSPPPQRQPAPAPITQATVSPVFNSAVVSSPPEIASLLANFSAVKEESPDPVQPMRTLERELNIHELPPDVLATVAFISEVDPGRLPPGLLKPLREQHDVSYNHALSQVH